MQLPLGFLLAILVATLAYRTHSLSKSGAIAATVTGTIIFGVGGLDWAILLLTFFITSSALSRAFKKRKQGLDEKFSKGHERDAGQVLGNGGVATAFAALHFFFPNEPWTWIGFAMITDLRKVVEKGTSGGISLVGTLAALAGSGLIGLLAVLLFPAENWSLKTDYFLLITFSGLAGALFDSFLGATVQAMYFCPTDKKETEKHPLHTCGTPTVHIRGWEWLDNDWVNFSCGAFGVIISLLLKGIL
ncbi:DUF92 domain-containing protein [bacterium]|nr:DUF92 domain-containing protein [bacterium]